MNIPRTDREPDSSPGGKAKVIVVTGAPSGIGAHTVRALARARHTVYGGMRDTAGRNAQAKAELDKTPSRAAEPHRSRAGRSAACRLCQVLQPAAYCGRPAGR
jgi:NAD(P)-dependent dehydrogenase (short-subunit alcohol dehydrogenase family)